MDCLVVVKVLKQDSRAVASLGPVLCRALRVTLLTALEDENNVRRGNSVVLGYRIRNSFLDRLRMRY